jgi:hypothetical protein
MRWLLLVVGCVVVAVIPSILYAQSCTQTTLHDEFFQDPTTRNYVSCATDGDLAGVNVSDSCVLNFFNAPCTNNAGCKVANILSREVLYLTIIDSAELEKLSRSTVANDVARKSQLDWILHNTSFDMSKASWQQKWKNVFTPADSPLTNAAINTAQLKDAPRSQVVCGRVGTLNDISCGLRGDGCH